MRQVFPPGPSTYRMIAFDLLTALMDSWSLWIDVAGEDALGRAWRRSSLQRVTTAGAYQPYEKIVDAAAHDVGLCSSRADDLLARWAGGELQPWPEAPSVLTRLAMRGWRTAVITNCSQHLAEAAATATGHHFDAVISAERAGFYKTDPRAYRAGLAAFGCSDPNAVLFVAGSAHDVPGAGAVGMPVYWSNRFADAVPVGAPAPLVNAPDLRALLGLLPADVWNP